MSDEKYIPSPEEMVETQEAFEEADEIPTGYGRLQNGKFVKLIGLSGIDRDKWERDVLKMHKGKKQVNVRGLLVARCMVNSKGERIYPDTHALKLGQKSSATLQPLFRLAQELSGFSDDEIDELEEDLEDSPLDDGSGE